MLLLAVAASADTWEGEFRTKKWPTFITVNAASGGTLNVLGQRIPVTDVRRDGDALRVVAGDVTLDGTIAAERWRGKLASGGETFDFELTRVPDLPKPKDRTEAWSQDLDALAQRFLRYDRSFSSGERTRFVEELDALRAELPRLDDAQITMRIASAIALARNGHTRLYLLRNRTELRRLPIRVWWFDDGLHVIRATPEYRKLLGCRIDYFDGVGARQAREIVSAAFAGNASWHDYMSVYSLTSPEALHGLGIAPSLDAIDLGVSGCGAAGRVRVVPLPLVKKSGATEAWRDLSPASAEEGWLHVLDGAKQLPLYLRNRGRNYWFEYLPQSGTLYFQYNRAADAPEESTNAFGERLLAELAKHQVRRFVLDLRFNTGGDLGIGRDLMTTLQEKTKGMPRYVVTGRNTFSAGISHVAMWKAQPGVTLVGEPVGDELDFWAEGGNIILPNSRLYAHFANGAHSYSPAPCPTSDYCYDLSVATLRPDVAASVTWRDYLRGVDTILNAISSR